MKSPLIELLALLDTADLTSDNQFHALITWSMNILGLSVKDVAHEFAASIPTVERWLNGTNSPNPAMRRPVYNWLAKLALEQLELLY